MKKLAIIALTAIALCVSLSACNTVSGLGRDLTSASETVREQL